jgi:hypothetical protein
MKKTADVAILDAVSHLILWFIRVSYSLLLAYLLHWNLFLFRIQHCVRSYDAMENDVSTP